LLIRGKEKTLDFDFVPKRGEKANPVSMSERRRGGCGPPWNIRGEILDSGGKRDLTSWEN